MKIAEADFFSLSTLTEASSWTLPGDGAGFYPGTEPHGASLKLYMNRTAAGAPNELPHGSIIVKENYSADSRTLMAITVMDRAKGYDSEHNDWYWVKYEPDGRASTMQGMPLAGKVSTCINCHRGAGDADFVYAND